MSEKLLIKPVELWKSVNISRCWTRQVFGFRLQLIRHVKQTLRALCGFGVGAFQYVSKDVRFNSFCRYRETAPAWCSIINLFDFWCESCERCQVLTHSSSSVFYILHQAKPQQVGVQCFLLWQDKLQLMQGWTCDLSFTRRFPPCPQNFPDTTPLLFFGA